MTTDSQRVEKASPREAFFSPSVAVLVLGNPFTGTSSHTALQFCQTVLQSGYRLQRVFFYHDAVLLGSSHSVSSQDEQNLPEAWQAFLREQQVDHVVCIASALKHGILDATESIRYDKPGATLAAGLELSGLGQWVEAMRLADKTIVFGNA